MYSIIYIGKKYQMFGDPEVILSSQKQKSLNGNSILMMEKDIYRSWVIPFAIGQKKRNDV